MGIAPQDLPSAWGGEAEDAHSPHRCIPGEPHSRRTARASRVQQCEVGRLRGSVGAARGAWVRGGRPAWSRARKRHALPQREGKRKVKKVKQLSSGRSTAVVDGERFSRSECALPAIRLSGKMRNILAVCGNRCSDETAIAAASAELPDAENARSWSIIGYQAFQKCLL